MIAGLLYYILTARTYFYNHDYLLINIFMGERRLDSQPLYRTGLHYVRRHYLQHLVKLVFNDHGENTTLVAAAFRPPAATIIMRSPSTSTATAATKMPLPNHCDKVCQRAKNPPKIGPK